MTGVEAGFEEAIELWDRRGWPRPSAMLVSGYGPAVELGDHHDRELPLAEVLKAGKAAAGQLGSLLLSIFESPQLWA